MEELIGSVTGITGVSAEKIAQWVLLLSFVLPYLIALVQQPAWSSAVRSRVSMGICAAAAAGVLYTEGALTVGNWLASAVGIFALTATFYKHFAKQNGARSLEDASTLSLLRAAGAAPAGAAPAVPDVPGVGSPAPNLSPDDFADALAASRAGAAASAAASAKNQPAGEKSPVTMDNSRSDAPVEESPDELVARYKRAAGLT